MKPLNRITRRKALGVLAALTAASLGVIPLSRNALHMAKYPSIPANRAQLPGTAKRSAFWVPVLPACRRPWN